MANFYQLPDCPVNAAANPVSGRYLAHNHMSPVERAFQAADLFMGEKRLALPTMTQAALLVRVNVTYAWWALKRLNERPDIVAGLIPLVPPRHVAAKTQPALGPATVDLPAITDILIDQLIAQAGPAQVWDRLAAAIG
jgi:hypothetical protein